MDLPRILQFQQIGDDEVGYISVAQYAQNIPYEIKRVYWVYHTPVDVERGNHAHRSGKSVLVALCGTVTVSLENTAGEVKVFTLDNPNAGLYIPELYWRKIKLSQGAVILSLASNEYDEKDYIREYSQFRRD